jgi:hypothetical protein
MQGGKGRKLQGVNMLKELFGDSDSDSDDDDDMRGGRSGKG